MWKVTFQKPCEIFQQDLIFFAIQDESLPPWLMERCQASDVLHNFSARWKICFCTEELAPNFKCWNIKASPAHAYTFYLLFWLERGLYLLSWPCWSWLANVCRNANSKRSGINKLQTDFWNHKINIIYINHEVLDLSMHCNGTSAVLITC